jgi:hypothetical protein
VAKVLQGSFFRDNPESKWVNVIHEYDEVYDRFDVRPPKIIVGLSITHRTERKFPAGTWAFPAVLDTGFNRVLEMDVRHFNRWTGYREEYLDILRRNQTSDDGNFDLCGANIWLHRSPYNNPRDHRQKQPLHLQNSSILRVMHESGPKHKPRMPLLGLQALIQNNLNLRIDARRGEFVITTSNGIRLPNFFELLAQKQV